MDHVQSLVEGLGFMDHVQSLSSTDHSQAKYEIQGFRVQF